MHHVYNLRSYLIKLFLIIQTNLNFETKWVGLVGFKVDMLNNPLRARIKFDETGKIAMLSLKICTILKMIR